jgi:hypothetical protein
MSGVWFASPEDAAAHQAAMHCVEDGQYDALAVAPLASGRLDPPDIALFYATPGAMMYFINGLQWSGYKNFEWVWWARAPARTVGARAQVAPAIAIDSLFCRAPLRRRTRDEMLMALPPEFLSKAIAGMDALAKNGFRYPFPQYGIQQDVRAVWPAVIRTAPRPRAVRQAGEVPCAWPWATASASHARGRAHARGGLASPAVRR